MAGLTQTVLAWARPQLRRLVRGVAMYRAVLWAEIRPRRNYIVERHPGWRDLDGARRVAIFIHYDNRGRVHDYVLHYLAALREVGFEIVVVSNAPKLGEAALQQLQPLCAEIVRRKNVGYDFGAYRDGVLALGDLSRFDELLLANDSVYGPLYALEETLARCDDGAAVWGVTDSWERRYHLQSYFLLFKKPALLHPSLGQFWRGVKHVQSKLWIIRRYEVGLTQSLIRGGLRCVALFPHRTAVSAFDTAVRAGGLLDSEALTAQHRDYLRTLYRAVERGDPVNMTHFFWDFLITDLRCPFIKRELLTQNPMGVPFIWRWEQVIRKATDYDTDLILRHLETDVRNRAV